MGYWEVVFTLSLFPTTVATSFTGQGGGGLIFWFVKGYRSVLRDSPNDILAGLMLAIIVVLELPPKLSFNNLKEKLYVNNNINKPSITITISKKQNSSVTKK